MVLCEEHQAVNRRRARGAAPGARREGWGGGQCFAVAEMAPYDPDDTGGYMEEMLPADCLSIQEIGTAGGVAMVLVWLCLLVCAIFMAFKAAQSESGVKRFCYLNAFVCAVSSYAYFAMFSGMGWETVVGCRQYFYIRHIDWAVSCALIVLSLGLLADQDLATTLAVMGSSVGMVFSGYLGAVGLVPLVKWLWFFVGILLFVPVVYALLREFRQTVIDKGDQDRRELYEKVALLTVLVWGLYPVVWILGVGIGAIGVSLENICYAVLDLFSKILFSLLMIGVTPYESVQVEQDERQLEKEYV